MSSPLFSIVIPTYNAGEKVVATLQSIAVQGYDSLEVVVMDGGSTDDTVELLRTYEASFIFSWRSEPDRGVYDAINRGIDATTGQFTLVLGAGDTLRADILKTVAEQIEALGLKNSPVFLYGDVWWPVIERRYDGPFSQWKWTQKNICQQSVFYSRSVFERHGHFDLRYPMCADWAFNLACIGDAAIEKRWLDLIVCDYEGGGLSATTRDENFIADLPELIASNLSPFIGLFHKLRRASPTGIKKWGAPMMRALDWIPDQKMLTQTPPEIGAADGISISVVVPTFNRGAKIQKTLDSALNQTLAPLEVIVVDDGSSDGTADWIAAHYGEKVRLIRQKNGGVARARNRGAREASGQWIAFLDHDDSWHPEKLETMAAKRGEAGVVVSRWREVVENGTVVAVSPAFEKPLLSGSGAFRWLFGWSNPLISMSVPLVRRDVLLEIGGFDSAAAPADDWDLWLRLSRRTSFAFVNEILVDYRLHEGQQRRDERRMFRATRRVLGKYPHELLLRPLLLWWLLWSGAFVASLPAYKRAKNGETGVLREALRFHPLSLLAPQWVSLLANRFLRRVKDLVYDEP